MTLLSTCRLSQLVDLQFLKAKFKRFKVRKLIDVNEEEVQWVKGDLIKAVERLIRKLTR